MANWTDATTLITSLLAGKAFTEGKAGALAENVVAMGEGATDAQRVEGRALDVYLGTISLSGTTEVAVLGLDRHTWLRGDFTGACDASYGGNLQVKFTADAGSTWSSAWTSLAEVAVSTTDGSTYQPGKGFGFLRLDVVSGEYAMAGSYASAGVPIAGIMGPATGTVTSPTLPTDCNGVKFRLSGANVTAKLYIDALGGIVA